MEIEPNARLLAGVSAFQWLQRMIILLLVGAVPFVLGLLFALLRGLNLVPTWPFLICWWLAAIIFVGTAVILGTPAILRYYRELRAGYTTVGWTALRFEQRDPYTGATLRQPGQPYAEAKAASRSLFNRAGAKK